MNTLLKALRLARGRTVEACASDMGINPERWTAWEEDYSQIPEGHYEHIAGMLADTSALEGQIEALREEVDLRTCQHNNANTINEEPCHGVATLRDVIREQNEARAEVATLTEALAEARKAAGFTPEDLTVTGAVLRLRKEVRGGRFMLRMLELREAMLRHGDDSDEAEVLRDALDGLHDAISDEYRDAGGRISAAFNAFEDPGLLVIWEEGQMELRAELAKSKAAHRVDAMAVLNAYMAVWPDRAQTGVPMMVEALQGEIDRLLVQFTGDDSAGWAEEAESYGRWMKEADRGGGVVTCPTCGAGCFVDGRADIDLSPRECRECELKRLRVEVDRLQSPDVVREMAERIGWVEEDADGLYSVRGLTPITTYHGSDPALFIRGCQALGIRFSGPELPESPPLTLASLLELLVVMKSSGGDVVTTVRRVMDAVDDSSQLPGLLSGVVRMGLEMADTVEVTNDQT